MARTGPDANPRAAGADQPTNGEIDDASDLPGELLPPTGHVRPGPPDDPTLSDGERRLRHELHDAVADARYPASREDLLAHVGPDQRGAVQARLRSLPNGAMFSSADEVARAFGDVETSR